MRQRGDTALRVCLPFVSGCVQFLFTSFFKSHRPPSFPTAETGTPGTVATSCTVSCFTTLPKSRSVEFGSSMRNMCDHITHKLIPTLFNCSVHNVWVNTRVQRLYGCRNRPGWSLRDIDYLFGFFFCMRACALFTRCL